MLFEAASGAAGPLGRNRISPIRAPTDVLDTTRRTDRNTEGSRKAQTDTSVRTSVVKP